jgi:hypothetical protein
LVFIWLGTWLGESVTGKVEQKHVFKASDAATVAEVWRQTRLSRAIEEVSHEATDKRCNSNRGRVCHKILIASVDRGEVFALERQTLTSVRR